jgi:RNA polymerase sigma factor (sigma-70 family)
VHTITRAAIAPRPQCLTCECYVSGICDEGSPVEGDGERSPRCCLDQPSDADLIRRHERESTDAAPLVSFGVLFDRHHRRVVAWACRLSGNYDLARDLAQEVFIKALTRIGAFRGDSRFTTWLYTVTRNTYRDYEKARARRPRESGSETLQHEPITENDALAALDAQHTSALVRRLMRDARLDRIEARAFRLHYGGDVPLETITARLGLTNRSGARAHIVSATRKLRRSRERWERLTARGGHAPGTPAAA